MSKIKRLGCALALIGITAVMVRSQDTPGEYVKVKSHNELKRRFYSGAEQQNVKDMETCKMVHSLEPRQTAQPTVARLQCR